MQTPHLVEMLKQAGFPKRAINAWYAASNTSIDHNDDYKEVFATFSAKMATGCMLGMLGPRGTGKTVMSVGLAILAIRRKGAVRYTTAHQFFMDIKDSYRRDSSESEREVVQGFRDPHFLVIDEVGRRQESDWENRTFFDLLNARYGDERDTLLIANLTQPIFEESMGDSIVSRMNECGGIVEIKWPSFRA